MLKDMFRQFFIIILSFLAFCLITGASNLDFQDTHIQTIGLFILLVLLMEFALLGLRALINLLKRDVLISNHAFRASKNSLDVTYDDTTDKIVLSRNQFDEAAILIVKAMSAITSGLC